MFYVEAQRIADRLAAWPTESLSPVVNIGSSTEAFRTEKQPWIDALIFAPLRARGVEVVHVDLKPEPGVDLVANLLDDEGYAAIARLRPRTILLCNLLEHVLEPAEFALRSMAVLAPDGRLLVSVPRSYPHHRDPIDTMFRPTPDEVAALAPEARLTFGEIIETGSYLGEVKRRPLLITRQILRAPFPFFGWEKWKRSMAKLYWLFNPYKVTIAVLEKA